MPLMEIFDINSAVETLKLLETDKRERANKKKKKKARTVRNKNFHKLY